MMNVLELPERVDEHQGPVGGAEGGPLGGTTLRFITGVDHDFVGLYRGLSIRRRAEAECERYRALSALRAATMWGADVGAEAALAARAQVLEAALPEARQLLDSLREDVREGRATVEELNALRLRLDGLRALAHETEKERERLAALPRLTERPLSSWLRDFRAADERVEAEAASLRSASAWTVRLREVAVLGRFLGEERPSTCSGAAHESFDPLLPSSARPS